MDKVATAYAPGTCGELVQGKIDGKNFLVTCPIDMWSKVTVFQPHMESQHNYNRENNKMVKIRKAIQLATKSQINFESIPSFIRESALPIGKGMGSSTADIIAAYTATCRLLGLEPTNDEIANVALSIEPSDGTMFPGISLFDHRKGLWREPLGTPSGLEVVIVDPGGSINTVAFNKRRQLSQLNAKKEPRIRQALTYVTEGIQENDPEKIGLGATISATANQEILPKPYLEEFILLSRAVKAVGVNVAHSGTVMGIIIAETESIETVGWKCLEVAEYVRNRYPTWTVYTSKIISGGVRS